MGAVVDRLISWPVGQGGSMRGPEGAGFEPAKLFRSLPI